MTVNGRILVVDDLPDWRDMISGLLQDQGYEVQTARDETIALQLLKDRPYHVAIVDLRLNEKDEFDRSGIDLATRMREHSPELAIIMFTGYPDFPSAKRALELHDDGTRIATDFLEKRDIALLLKRIQTVIDAKAKINPRLRIQLRDGLDWKTLHQNIKCLRTLDRDMAQQEITDLLQRLFYRADEVRIHPLEQGHGKGVVALATPVIQDIAQREIVVKFNEAERANQEAANYTKFVADFIGSGRRTQLLDCRSTARLGGITYSFIGSQYAHLRSLREIYASQTSGDLRDVLDNIFLETCHTWYTNTLRANSHRQSLGASYRTWLSISDEEISSSLAELTRADQAGKWRMGDDGRVDRAPVIVDTEQPIKLLNPLPLSHSPFAYSGPFCFTHGDLHEDNVLIDNHKQTWLIDFGRTGPAHPVRDFALLESAIKFFLQSSHCSDNVLYDWECSLVQVDSLGDPPSGGLGQYPNPEIVKATQLIVHLRRLVVKVLPDMTLRDYQIALYFHAMKGMALSTKFSIGQRRHALISASLLATVLQQS